jgi:hypothetical protein
MKPFAAAVLSIALVGFAAAAAEAGPTHRAVAAARAHLRPTQCAGHGRGLPALRLRPLRARGGCVGSAWCDEWDLYGDREQPVETIRIVLVATGADASAAVAGPAARPVELAEPASWTAPEGLRAVDAGSPAHAARQAAALERLRERVHAAPFP